MCWYNLIKLDSNLLLQRLQDQLMSGPVLAVISVFSIQKMNTQGLVSNKRGSVRVVEKHTFHLR